MKQLLRNLALVALLCVPWVTQAQTLTVYGDATANNQYVPFDGYNADAAQHNQMIYPATELTSMTGKEITQMVFYIDGTASNGSNTAASRLGTWTVSLGETDATTLSGLDNSTALTQVYQGNFDCSTGTLTLTFSDSYLYNGGNLLVDLNHAAASYNRWYFVGVTSTGSSYTYGNQRNFLPKVAFSYETPSSCAKPTAVSVSGLTATGATISWTDNTSGAATYTIKNGDAEVATTAAGATSYTLTGLSANTTYSTFTVTANCGGDHSATVSVPSFYTGYCNPAPSSVDGSGISAVAFGAGSYLVNNTTRPTSSPYYGNYSAQIGAAIQGETANVNITFATGYTYGTVIWIDWNNNLTFEDSEIVYAGEAASDNPTTLSASFSVAAGQALGDYRMRIAAADSYYDSHKTMATAAGADPCPSSTYTVVHDYTVRVIPAPTCFMPTAAEATNLATDGATISWTRDARNAAGETYTIMNGSAELGTTAAGATSFNVTGLSANTEYTLTIMTNCAAGDESVDNVLVTFTTLANCATPVLTAEGVTNIAAHTADVAWTGYASNNSFMVNYRTKAYFDGVNEGFGTAIPTGWENKQGLLSSVMGGTALTTGSNWSFGSNNGVFDNHARINIYGTTRYGWLITPQMTVPAGGALNFDLALTAYSGNVGAPATTGTDDRFVVLVTTDNEATWTILREWNNSGSAYVYNDIVCSATGESVNIDLSAYAGQTVRIAFYGESTTSNADNNLHIDNVAIGLDVTAGAWQEVPAATASVTLTGLESETQYEVKVKGLCDGDVESEESAVVSFTTLEGCMAPTALAVAPENITTTTAVVGWTNGYSTDDAWEINYRVSGAAEWTVVNATTNPYTLTGLDANTAYEVRMRTNCGAEGYSDWSATVSFRTACGQEAIPFSENFDSYESGVFKFYCWTYVPEPALSSSYAFVRYNYSSYAHSGSYTLRSYIGASSQNNKVILPEMDAATNTLQVRFWHRSGGATAGTLSVGYVTDIEDTSTFVPVVNYTAANCTTYAEYEVEMAGVPADARIAFRHVSTSNYTYWYIDDVTVEPIPACKKVTAVATSDVTSNSATVSWTDDRNGEDATYSVYNGSVDPANLLGTTEAGVKTFTIMGLTPNTNYNAIVVVANCAADEHSAAVGVPSFTTQRNECAITAFNITTDGIRRGDAAIDAVNHTVAMPIYYTTDFSSASGSISYSTSAVAYMYNAETEAWDISVSSWNTLRSRLQLGANSVRVFAQDRNVYADWTITLQPEDCTTPAGLTLGAERIRVNVTINNNDPSVSAYQLVCSTTALDAAGLAAAEKTAVSGNTYTIENLDRETEYHVYVRANCGGDSYSEWRSGTVTTKGLSFCEDVVVAGGSNPNDHVPFYGLYIDEYVQHTQSVYPASMLTSLVGKSLTSMTYRSNGNKNFGTNSTFKIGVVNDADLSSAFVSTTGLTTVYTGSIVASSNKITITFSAPFVYDGGDLVVDFESLTTGSYSSMNFYGTNSGSSRYEGDGSSDVYTFVPELTFHYCETNDACPAVTAVEATDITETEATLTWEAVTTADYLSGYQVLVTSTELDAATLAAYDGPYTYEGTATTYDATGLTAYTMYYVYVRANCQAGGHDDGSSQWLSYSFRTMSQCGAVTNISVVQTGKSTATATWEKTKPAQDNNFNYILSTTGGLDDATLNGMPKTGTGLAEATASLAGLSPATTYYLYVQNDCGGEGTSPWVSQSFTSYDAMPAVVNIAATEVTHTAMAFSWERNTAQFADETQWQVAVVAHDETPASWTTVSAMHYTAVGLTPETSYDIYVRPYQASPEAYGSASHLDEVTTTATPSDCVTIGEGTGTSYGPVCGYYGYERNAYLFTADDGLRAGNILSLAWNYTGSGTIPAKIYLKNTDLTALPALASFTWSEQIADATLVYDASASIATGWNDFVFAAPFNYTGGGLIVYVASSYGGYGGASVNAYYTASGSNNHIVGRKDNSVDDNSAITSMSSPTLNNQRHNTKFCFEASSCPDLSRVTVSDVTTNSAAISWMPGNAETSWQYVISAGETEASALEAAAVTTTATEYLPTGLTPDVDYYFYIRPVCGVDEYGSWTMRQFTTVATCGKPTVLAAIEVTTTTATLNALAHPTIGTASTYTFRYWKDGDEENKTVMPAQAANSAAIGSLLPNTTYWFDVMVSCTGAAGDSRWSEPLSFTTEYQNLTLPYSTVFAEGRDNEWKLVNGTHANEWHIGTAASNTANGRGLYISNDGGVTNAYTNSDAVTLFAYAGFSNFEASKQYTVDFYWRNNGESGNYDYVRAWIVPDDVAIDITGSTSYGTNNPTGWLPADGGSMLNDVTEWQSKRAYVTVPADGAYKIVFMWWNDGSYGDNPPAAIDSVVVRESDKYTVTVNVAKDAENNVLGSYTSEPAGLVGLYDNTSVTLSRGEAIYGYHFTNWTDNDGSVLGTGASLSFTLHSDTIVNVNYDSNQYTITAAMVAQQESEGWGTVSGTATVNFNLPVTLTATPAVGYHFVNWTNSAAAVSGTEETLTVNAYRDSTFTAHFDTNVYEITVNAVSSEMGTAEGPATLKHFLSADYVATPNYGYHFVNWADGAANVLGSETTLAGFSPVANTTLNANFDYNTYTITAVSANAVMGSAAGTQTVNYLSNVTLNAGANYGYHFVNWTAANGDVLGTTESITVQALRDSVITANFDYNQYTVTVATANATMGGVSGTTTQNYLTEVQIAATPNYGYHFTQWNDGNTDNPRTVVITADATYTASFDYNQYTVTAQTSNATMGSATGTQTVNYLTPVTLTAAANYGYSFAGWYEADTLYSNELVIAVPALSDRTLTATYTINQYTVTVESDDEVMGSVSGTATEDYLTNITITATANPGYHFVRWNDNSTVNPREVSVTENATYTAYFTYNQYTVSVSSASTTMGTVAPATSTLNFLSSVEISATPKTGYHFTQWNDGNTDNPRTVTVSEPGDLSFTASFDTNVYTVTTAVNDEAMGSVTESSSVKHFKSIALVATPNYGYHFVNWTDANGTAKGNAATLNVSPVSDTALTANFTYNQYTVTGQSANTTMGTVSGTATVNYLTDVTLTAAANYGYHFTGWSNGATTESITIQATKDTTVTALFDYNQYTVTGLSADDAKGTVSGTATVSYLTDVVLTATAATGYHFVQWNDGNTDNPRTVSATENMTFTATFAINLYNITLAYNAERGVLTNDDASGAAVAAGYVFENVEHGSTLHLTAEVFEGSRFAGWGDGNITVNTASIEYTALRNATLTANFIDAGNFQVSINYDEAMGTVTGAGEHHADNDVTVTATPNYGYHFVAWVNGEDSVFTPSYTFVMPTSEVELTAVFDYNQYTVTPVSGNAAMGSVSEEQTVNYLSPVAISATANYGYHFVNWTNAAGDVIATTSNATVQALRDSVVTANFDYNQYTVTGTCNEAMGTVSGTATVNYLTPVTLTATAGTCYHFVGWSNGETTETITVEATADITVTALFEANVYSSEETVDVCDSYTWNGRTYIVGGTYSIDTVNANGCDSTATLLLTIRHSNSGTDVQNHCDTYTWIDGVTYTETPAAEPTFTLTNADGCDSVVTLNLTVRHSTTGDTAAVACDSFEWYGETYTETPAVAPTHVFTNAAGCDSTVTLTLIVNHSNSGDTAAVACDSFEWYGETYTETPTVAPTHVFTNAAGCDSTVTLTLVVNHSNTGDTATVACDSFEWYGVTYTETPAVAPTHVFTNAAGCDSTVTLNLTVNHSNTGDTAAVACDSFDWYEHTGLTESQTVQHVFTNAAGCDSTVTLNLTVNHSNSGDTAAVACDSFEWYGVTYTETPAVAPTHVFTNAAGCDSTVTLTLIVNHSNTGDTAAVACDSFEWYGVTYTETPAVAPTHVFTNAAGCDSTVTLTLVVNHSTTGDTAAMACDSFEWYGVTYTETPAVAPTHVFTNAAGCDSTVTLTLVVNHSTTGDTAAVACDSFEWYGVTYTETPAVAPTHVFTNAAGCDSTVTLNLTVNHSTVGDTAATAVDSFEWYGVTYTESGDYTYTTTNAAGCDSTVTLTLTITHYDSVTVVLSVNDASMGTTNPLPGTYRFYPGETASATATANQGYLFAGWVVNGDTMSTDNTVSFEVLPAMAGMTFSVVAAFEAEPSPYLTVNATANDTSMGIVIGAGQYAEGSVVTLMARSKPGHHFVSWSNGVTDSIYVFTLTADTTLVATFAPNVGIETVDYSNISIYSADSRVYVKGAEGMTIYIYDVNGRCMARRANAADIETFQVETTGVILVKAGNAPAKRVIVVR